jgi:hypothetical protein
MPFEYTIGAFGGTVEMQSYLDGRRILILEGEPLIALDIEAKLADAGARIVGPAHSEAEAMSPIDAAIANAADTSPIAGNVLDIHLGNRTCEAVAARLTSRKVTFVFHGGFARDTETFVARSTAPYLRKPASGEALIQALGKES